MDMEPHTMLLELGPTSSSGLWTPKAALSVGNQAGHAHRCYGSDVARQQGAGT